MAGNSGSGSSSYIGPFPKNRRIMKSEEVIRLKQIELDWNKAIEENDLTAMAEFMSDEWILFSGNGTRLTKQTFMDLIAKKELTHTEMNFEILDAKIFDHTGIVLTKGTSSGYWKGQPFSNYEITSSVFIHRDGKWLAVQTMLAPANKNE